MTEKEYRELDPNKYFNYSMLAGVDKEGAGHLIKKREEKKGTKWGSVAHTLLFQSDTFDEKYKVLKYTDSASATYMDLFSHIKTAYLEHKVTLENIINKDDIYKELCLSVIEENSYWKNITKTEVRIGKVTNEAFLDFVTEELENITDKREFISSEMFMDVQWMCKILKVNEFTAPYLISDNIKKKQILFEIPIIFQMLQKDFKALLDMIFIDHEKKTIRVIDLKTTAFKSIGDFIKAFFKYRYDIQASVYTVALETFIIENNLKDYRILDPLYIAVRKGNIEFPLVFKVDREVIKEAITGYQTVFNQRVKGIFNLIQDIEYYRKNKKFDYPVEMYEDGSLSINSGSARRYNIPIPFPFTNYTQMPLTSELEIPRPSPDIGSPIDNVERTMDAQGRRVYTRAADIDSAFERAARRISNLDRDEGGH